ncbi:MAG: PqqD family protein [Lysobacterales bacterium]|nr:MAG: PqqD family protein [Xanthomonadales bacterium]
MLAMKIEISDEVLFQEVSGETVLLDLASEQYFGLDAVGTRVWQLLGAGASAEAVVETLLEEYEVEREQLAADIDELLGRLAEAGLIRIVDEAGD